MADVLHDDDPRREGNYSAEEYEATYAEGGWCGPTLEQLAEAEAAIKNG